MCGCNKKKKVGGFKKNGKKVTVKISPSARTLRARGQAVIAKNNKKKTAVKKAVKKNNKKRVIKKRRVVKRK